MPNWPIQRLRSELSAAEPDAAHPQPPPESFGPEAPLVLWGIDPRRGRLVVACCERAAARGVRVGMTVGEADSLLRGHAPQILQHAPQILQHAPQILQHDSEADLEALRRLAEACAEELSPIVALEPLDDFLWAGQVLHQPQALLLDVTGVGELFGSEAKLAAAAEKLLGRQRLEGRIAIADTAGAAWGLAHYGTASNSLCLIPPAQTSATLDRLPVAALRIRSETAAMLRRLGVERIEALRRLPRSGLATRLGTDLLRRLDQALGAVDEPLPAHHAAASDRAAVDLEYPTRDLDILRHQVEGLVRQVARGLAERQRGALRLVCRFDLEQPPAVEVRIGLFAPSATAEHLLRLLAGNLERCRFPSLAHRVVVAATLTGPLTMHQPTLGDIGGDEQGSVIDLARLIDGLSSRLGRSRVLGVELTEDPLPEQAIRLRPLAGQPIGAIVPGRPAPRRRSARRTASRERSPRSSPSLPSPTSHSPASHSPASRWTSATHPPTPSDPLRRPLMMFSQPVPLSVLAPGAEASRQDPPRARAGEDSQAPAEGPRSLPERFRFGGRVHRIVRHWGPERLETGWWNGPMHRRDYYRVETEEGAWLWIYHDLKQDRWWLHGHFF